MAEVVGALSAAGYHVQTREFDAALLLPQRRRRVFLACFRDAAAARIFAWPALPALRRCAYDALQPAEQLWQRHTSWRYRILPIPAKKL